MAERWTSRGARAPALLLTCTAALGLTLVSGVARADPLSLDADPCVVTIGRGSLPPYVYTSETGENAGSDVAILESALGSMGCRVEWLRMPWARIVVEVENGRLDMAPYAIRTPQREQFAHFSRPYMCETTRVWVHADAPSRPWLKRFGDIIATEFVLGVVRGAVYTPEYGRLREDPFFDGRLHVMQSTAKLFEMFSKRRIDGMVSRDLEMYRRMEQAGLDGAFVPSGIQIDVRSVSHFMFSRASVARVFVERFNHELGQVMADGRFDEIVSAYHPDPAVLRPRYSQSEACAF